MKLKQILLCSLIWLSCVSLKAQTTKEEMFFTIEKTGGVYLAYPLDFSPQIKTPKGYKPFYVSHYGRHGSRYLLTDHDYKWLINLFEDAHSEGALSELGEDIYRRLLKVWEEVKGYGGDLTPLGVRQQRGIAERMYTSFPEAFKGNPAISARSTVVLRCVMSMVAFGDRLKELNPDLHISYEASSKYMDYMNYQTDESNRFTSSYNGPWVEEYRKFEEIHTNPDRLVASLFNDKCFILKKVNPKETMWSLYWIASDMQNAETEISFYDIFEPQELFDLWQCINYQFYVRHANHADGKGIVMENAKSLLNNILDSADEAIRYGGIAATLRFGHDGNVASLVALMQIENYNVAVSDPYEVYKVWSDFKVVPMAANLQIVFFCNENEKGSVNDIIVKILHNENEVHIPVQTDIFPFYKWSDVENYYRNLLK